MRTANHQALTRPRQHGAALLVMLTILITGGAYLLVSQLNRATYRIENDQQTAEALAQAKEALIGWAVSRDDPLTPGIFPYADRSNDGNYDGQSDCPGGPVNAGLLLGKIPRIGTGGTCLGGAMPLGLDVVDSAGEVLWYAVSRNIVGTNTTPPVINPNLLINPPPFPWLVVRDQNGNLINDRVAFLLIAPGPALPGQNRTVPPSPPAPPTEYLESINVVSNADFNGNFDVGGPCPTVMCEDFVMSEPWPSATAPTFNDRLLYVTIDELMPLIEMRVARQVRLALRNSVPPFPPPAAMGYASYNCGTTEGFLPIPVCECKSNGTDLSCDCPFDTPPKVSITYSYTGPAPPVFTPGPVGQCTAVGSSCQCMGAGSCSGPTQSFRCSADGVCIANNIAPTTFSISYSLPNSPPAVFANVTKIPAGPGCTGNGTSTMSCSNFTEAQGIIVGGCTQVLSGPSGLPLWFLSNRWKNFMYYAATPPLTVGAANVNAVVISVGRPLLIGAPPILQTRPSLSRNNYLDDFENSNGPPAFTGVGQPLTNMFNDQAVIVAP